MSTFITKDFIQLASHKAFPQTVHVQLQEFLDKLAIHLEAITLDQLNKSDWIDCPLLGMYPSPSNAPTAVQHKDDGAGSHGTYLYSFADATNNSLLWNIVLPQRYRAATNIIPWIVWTTPSAAAGNVVWKLEYTLTDDRGVVSGTTSVISLTSAAPGVADTIVRDAWAAIDGSAINEGGVWQFRIYRAGGDAADTFTGTVLGISLLLEIVQNKDGVDYIA